RGTTRGVDNRSRRRLVLGRPSRLQQGSETLAPNRNRRLPRHGETRARRCAGGCSEFRAKLVQMLGSSTVRGSRRVCRGAKNPACPLPLLQSLPPLRSVGGRRAQNASKRVGRAK